MESYLFFTLRRNLKRYLLYLSLFMLVAPSSYQVPGFADFTSFPFILGGNAEHLGVSSGRQRGIAHKNLPSGKPDTF